MTDAPSNSPNDSSTQSPRGLLYGIGALVVIGLGGSLYVMKKPADAPAAPAAPAAVAPTSATTAAAGTTGAPGAVGASGSTSAAAPSGQPDLSVDESGLSKAVVTMETTKGTIKYRFYSKDAPKTVARMVELIQQNFYNGLIFHRYVEGFVIQGGDPNGTGMGGSGQKLKAEFNSRKHVLGTVAMARAQDPDSADSQFYIVLAPAPHLDGNYTAFGQVSEGLDVVQALRQGDKMTKVSVQ
jgi:cyclophilin family peptidyl-prolyl cis-trans isomerase